MLSYYLITIRGDILLEHKSTVYLGEGKPPPSKGYKKLYNTPMGPFPKLVDVALQYKMYKSNVYRRYINKSDKFKDWYVIINPTSEQNYQAIQNVNTLFTEKYEAEDNCPLCNHVDDMIFSEGCWLLRVEHRHGDLSTKKAVIHYIFRKKEYKVTYQGWVDGKRPHLQ